MERTGLSIVGLAAHLRVRRPSLNRFLNFTPGYEPQPSRPSMMRILEQIEEHCGGYFIWSRAPLDRADAARAARPQSDERAWYDSHLVQLEAATQKYSPEDALGPLRVLAIEAEAACTAFAETVGAAMVANALLGYVMVVDRLSAETTTRGRLSRVLSTIARLDAAFDAHAQGTNRSERMHKVVGYSGYCRTTVGRLLDDEQLIVHGLDQQLAATQLPNELEDGLWQNLLDSVEELLGMGHAVARRWSTTICEHAANGDSPNLNQALAHKSLPQLRAHWHECAPALACKFWGDGEEG